MNISFNWLKDYIETGLTVEETGKVLTDIGLEVEGIEKTETVKGGLQGLVIGEVLEKTKHPDADRLSITKVNVGTAEPLQIVCGASNVAVGQKVVVALNGATLFPSSGESFTIKKSKIRGVESNGMICAEDEIGWGTSHDGIMVLDPSAKTGSAAADYFKIETDYCISIGLTPNRIDAVSHFGVARDFHAALLQRGLKSVLKKPAVENFHEGDDPQKIAVEVQDKQSCPRYAGLVIKNVKAVESPAWLQKKLKAIGLRPINAIVDVTNFVMHECGQPLHAFDADKIAGGKIVVRKATAGKKFVTLDGTERTLNGHELMICDAEKEMCIAGVFGGLHSGVSEQTTSVFLESAYFDPSVTRKSARAHELNTDSSFRFERGMDIENIIYALKRAALLICEVTGGSVASKITDTYPNPVTPLQIDFSIEHACRLIGKNIPAETIKNILQSLDIKTLNENGNILKLELPLYRVDVTRETDVTEEILRIYGYNNIELPGKINASVNHFPRPSVEQVNESVALLLSSAGYSEMMNNSLTRIGYTKEETAVKLLNPLSSELDVMRQSLLFSGLESIAYNLNRQQYDLKLFEFGKIYFKNEKNYSEQNILSVFVTGKAESENWTAPDHRSSFYTIKAAVNAIFERTGLAEQMRCNETGSSIFHSGITYEIRNKIIAEAGEVKDEIVKSTDVRQPVFYAEINMDILFDFIKQVTIRFKEIPKFPVVRRDLSLLLDKEITFAQIEELAYKAEKKLVKKVGLFDVYEGKNIEKGKKSYAISVLLSDTEQTLTDQQVEKVMNDIQRSLEEKLGAKLR
ncbi:MAG: phenylalanine--tRNA ligase subunit beta [Bacteroidota bacterium]